MTSPPQGLPQPVLAPTPDPRRRLCGAGVAFWAVVFLWLLAGATPLARVLGTSWWALGFVSPTAYVFSLALALPWFGNNPGGAHLLYLWDMGMMGCVAGHLARRALGRVQRRPHRLDPWVTLFVACTWAGLNPQLRWLYCELVFEKLDFMRRIYTHYANAEVYGLRVALDVTLAAGLYVALRDRPWSARRQSALMFALLGAAAFTAVVGLLQYAGWIYLGWWRGENPENWRWGYHRLQSLYWHPGWLAEYLAFLAPMAMALAWRARRGASKAGWGGLLILLAVTGLLTMARAGWLALAAGLGAVAVLATRKDKDSKSSVAHPSSFILHPLSLLLTLLVLASLLALLIPELRARLGELAFFEHRTQIWSRAWRVIGMVPLGGIGTGDYAHFNAMYFHDDVFANQWITAHNQYLQLWVERGLPGLAIYLVIVWIVGSGLWRAMRSEEHHAAQTVRMALLGGLAAFLVNGLFQDYSYVRAIDTLFWLMIGWSTWVAAPAPAVAAVAPAVPPRRRRRWAMPVAIAAMTLLTLEQNGWRLIGYWPWRVWVDGDMFRTGAKEKVLEVPRGARHVRLAVATVDPNLQTDPRPLVYTVTLGDETLTSTTFHAAGRRTLELELPAQPPSGAVLKLSVSRTWSPWGYGWHGSWPILEMGVMWLDPVADDQSTQM